jgi:hypothetical protein
MMLLLSIACLSTLKTFLLQERKNRRPRNIKAAAAISIRWHGGMTLVC